MLNQYKDLIAGRKFFYEATIDEKKWLINQLPHRKSRARWNAACLLGKCKCEESVNALIIALKDEHWLVRLHAAKALGKIRPRQAIEPLRDCLQDDCLYVQREARVAIGRIGIENKISYSEKKELIQEAVDIEEHQIPLKRQLPPPFDINRNEIVNIKRGLSRFTVGFIFFFFLYYITITLDKFEVIPFFIIPIVLIWDNLKVIVSNALGYRKKRAWIKNAEKVQVPIVDRIIEIDDYAETWEAYSNCELAVKHSCSTVNGAHNQIIWAKVNDKIYHKYEGQDCVYIFYDTQNPYSFVIEDE